jgi:hypothetical protein
MFICSERGNKFTDRNEISSCIAYYGSCITLYPYFTLDLAHDVHGCVSFQWMYSTSAAQMTRKVCTRILPPVT